MSEGIFGIRADQPRGRQVEVLKANTWVQVFRAVKSSPMECDRLLKSVRALHSIVEGTVEHMSWEESSRFISSAARYFSDFVASRAYSEPCCDRKIITDLGDRFVSFMGMAMADKDAALSQGDCPAELFCHSFYVGEFAECLAAEMGYDPKFFRIAGKLHDMGKIYGVPDRIVGKQGPLTDSEFKEVKKHAFLGANLLRRKGMGCIADVVLTVHKRYDCTGYPEDVEIDMTDPKNGVLAVCDTCDVVSRGRPYQPGEGIEYALEELRRSAGTQLHPQVVEIAVKSGCLERKFSEIADEACLQYMERVA